MIYLAYYVYVVFNKNKSLFKKSLKNQIEGMVVEAFPGVSFKVKISENKEILAYLAGKMRIYRIKVLPGDKVLIELSPDGDRGRIIRRL